MRNLWILFAALLAGLVVALYIASPVDPLHRLGYAVLGPAFLDLPLAEPITRYADAALAGTVAAYFLIFLPLSAATWIAGGRQARLIRNALTDPSDAPMQLLPLDAANPWWPLLAPYAARADEAAGVVGAAASARFPKGAHAAAIDTLVIHQSGATVFGGFPLIALGLGVIALAGQLLPILAADPGALADPARSALGAALARGFCSLVVAVAVAALFGLLSRLVAAILRRRAESLLGGLDDASRRWVDDFEDEPVIFATPRPARDHSTRIDDTLVDEANRRDVAESVDNAIRELQTTTLRPMLHDISRLLSLLGERASQLVATVDDRLAQQAEHGRLILAATQQISRTLADRAARTDGLGVAAVSDDLAIDELRQALRDERAAAVALLRSAGEEVAGRIDAALESATRSLAEPLSAHADLMRAAIERMDAAAAALARSGGVLEQSVGAIEQQFTRLAAPQADGADRSAGSIDMAAVMEPLAAQAEAMRRAVERIDAMAESLARTGGQIVQSSGAIAEKLDSLAILPEAVARAAAPGAGTVDIAALLQPVTDQAEAVRQIAERIDAATAAMSRSGGAIERASGAFEQQLGLLASAQEAQRGAADAGTTSEDIAALAQPLWAQTDAVRQVVERMDAAAEAMKRTGNRIEHSTSAIEQKLDRLAEMQQARESAPAADVAPAEIAALLQPLADQAEAVRRMVERIDAAAAALARSGGAIEQSLAILGQKLDRPVGAPEPARARDGEPRAAPPNAAGTDAAPPRTEGSPDETVEPEILEAFIAGLPSARG